VNCRKDGQETLDVEASGVRGRWVHLSGVRPKSGEKDQTKGDTSKKKKRVRRQGATNNVLFKVIKPDVKSLWGRVVGRWGAKK